MVLDFRPFGCLLSSFSAAFCRFPSFWLPFVFSLAALLGPLLPPQSLNIGFEIYGFGFLSFWLPFVFLFGCFLSISVLLAACCLPFRLLFVDFRPFGCLLSSLWLPCWARCSLRSPLNIGFEIYGFGFLSFWLPFVFLFGCFWSISVLLAAFCFLFGCFLSISVLLAAFCLLFGCLVGPAAPSAVP